LACFVLVRLERFELNRPLLSWGTAFSLIFLQASLQEKELGEHEDRQ
jgi:hypothetical protein